MYTIHTVQHNQVQLAGDQLNCIDRKLMLQQLIEMQQCMLHT